MDQKMKSVSIASCEMFQFRHLFIYDFIKFLQEYVFADITGICIIISLPSVR
jgi:hypothetical protein